MTTETETRFYSNAAEGGLFILKQEPAFHAGAPPEFYELSFHPGDSQVAQERPMSVTIYHRKSRGEEQRTTQVNWAAMGSQSRGVAAEYGALLTKAAEFAAALDGGWLPGQSGPWNEVEPVDGRWAKV